MPKLKHHIFVCSSSRVSGEPKGTCNRKDAADLIMFIENGINDRGIEDILVSNTGCLKLCERGPVMVIYPEGYWYGELNEEKIELILDALEEGRPVAELLLP